MSTSGDTANSATPGAGGARHGFKGLAFKAGTIDLERSSTEWVSLPVSGRPKPAVPDFGLGPRLGLGEPEAPSAPARMPTAPRRRAQWPNAVLLGTVCVLLSAAGSRLYRDHFSGDIEAAASPAALPAKLQAAPPAAPLAVVVPQQPPAQERAVRRDVEPAPAADTRRDTAAVPAWRPAADDAEVTRLLARARLLLDVGDVSAARDVLAQAAEAGSPIATFALAESYDPVVLAAWGAVGTRGDPAKAQQLYARAAAGGVEAAKGRLDVSRQSIRGEARQ